MPEYEVHQNVRIEASNAQEAIAKVRGTPIILKAREIPPNPPKWIENLYFGMLVGIVPWMCIAFYITINIFPFHAPPAANPDNEGLILFIALVMGWTVLAIILNGALIHHWRKSLK